MEKWKDKLFERFSISHEELDWLLFNATEVSFGPNTTIVDEQEIDTHLYILVEGVWRAYTYREGKEATIWFASYYREPLLFHSERCVGTLVCNIIGFCQFGAEIGGGLGGLL